MKNNIRRFCFPTSAREAARLMGRWKGKVLVVAGGTRLTHNISPNTEAVVDLSDIPLKHIQADKKWLKIGALCTIDELEKSPLLSRWARGVIAKTAGFVSNAPARSMGTVGGNVVRPHPCNNLPAVFLALDALAVYTDGRREKTMPFAELLKPEIMRGFGAKYLLTEIRVPAKTKSWSAAADRLAATKTDWEAWANCVVAVEKKGSQCLQGAIVLGAVLPRTLRMAEAEALLAGRPCDESTARSAGQAVSSELRRLTAGSAAKAYACEVAGVLARRVLIEAFKS